MLDKSLKCPPPVAPRPRVRFLLGRRQHIGVGEVLSLMAGEGREPWGRSGSAGSGLLILKFAHHVYWRLHHHGQSPESCVSFPKFPFRDSRSIFIKSI